MSRGIKAHGRRAAHEAGQPFQTRTDPGQITAAQLAAGAFVVLGAGMALVNLIWLAVAGDLDRLWFVFGGAVVAAASGWLLRLLRQRQRAELTIALSGVTYATSERTRNWGWHQLEAVAFGDGLAGRLLIIETRAGAEPERQWPPQLGVLQWATAKFNALRPVIAKLSVLRPAVTKLGDLQRAVANASPLATLLPLRYLEADEVEIRDAIWRFSRGRFPDPDRRGPRVPARDREPQ